MTPDAVVDIGNTRIKWGRVRGGRVADVAALGLADAEAWRQQAEKWGLGAGARWVMAGVNPPAARAWAEWIGGMGGSVTVLASHTRISLALDVDAPESVGLDRLLGCLAAKARATPGKPFLVVQAGTALVINLVNADGAFAGGAILPGLALMAKALHAHTALLPEVRIDEPVKMSPGRTTDAAIRSGIYWACVGAILTLRAGYGDSGDLPIYLTGGDATLLLPALPEPVVHAPDLVLEGIRMAAEALP